MMFPLKKQDVVCFLLCHLYFTHFIQADSSCVKNLEKLNEENQSCGVSCATFRCLNPDERCICDGICGLVCINPLIRCGKLMDPENGFVVMPAEDYYNKTAHYICMKGYELIGAQKRVCQSDGSWSGVENPFCTPKDFRCPPPEYLFENAIIPLWSRKHDYYFGDEVQYQCDIGFTSLRRRVVTTKCEIKDGKPNWTPTELTCEANKCSIPEPIKNGYYEGNDFTFGKEVYYVCNNGYYLVGFSSRICLADGEWSSDPPTCEIVRCPEPRQPINGAAIYSKPLRFLDGITYTCNEGFTLRGHAVRQCNELGELTYSEPTCEAIDCGSPDTPDNGAIAYLEGTKWQQKVFYTCNEHTTIYGEDSAACRIENKNPTWSAAPLCIRHCIVPTTNNSYFEFTRQKLKSGSFVPNLAVAIMHCDPGYELDYDYASDANTISQCEDGNWTSIISCRPRFHHTNVKCHASFYDNLDIHSNGMKVFGQPRFFNHSSLLLFRCMESDNFKLIGPNMIECKRGLWTSPWPTCIQVRPFDLNTPPPIKIISNKIKPYRLQNGHFWMPLGSDVYFVCLFGSERVKPDILLNGQNIDRNSNVGRVAYYSQLKVWYLRLAQNSVSGHWNFSCSIPNKSPAFSNDVTLYLGNKCTLDDDWLLQKNFTVAPSSRRSPFYVEGDIVYLINEKPRRILCGSSGWSNV